MFYSKRVRKKKRLTDPVEIIPFPNQGKKEVAAPATPTKRVPTSNPALSGKVENKKLSVPTGQLNTSNFSIKKAMLSNAPKEEKEQSLSPQNTLAEAFNFDQFKMAWKQYAFQAKQKGLNTLYNALIKKDPVHREGLLYILELENQIQVDYINQHLHDLIGFMRDALKNYQISIEMLLIEGTESEVRFLTGKDRFAIMAKKNPNLTHLKQIFNLDIEY